MNNDAAPSKLDPSLEACPACGHCAIDRQRVRTKEPDPPVEALWCYQCGEWWFELWGNRITTEAIIRMGLGS